MRLGTKHNGLDHKANWVGLNLLGNVKIQQMLERWIRLYVLYLKTHQYQRLSIIVSLSKYSSFIISYQWKQEHQVGQSWWLVEAKEEIIRI